MTEDSGPTASKSRHFPWLTLIKVVGAPLAAGIGSVIVGHYQADAKKAEVVQETAKVDNSIYLTLATKQAEQAAVIAELREAVAKLAIAQVRTIEAAPVRRKRGRATVASTTAKTRIDDTAKTLREIKEKALAPAPALAPVPTTIPTEPPSVADGAKIPTVRNLDAGGKQ